MSDALGERLAGARTALAYLVSMAQGHDYADGYKISNAEDALIDVLDALDNQEQEIAAARAEAWDEAVKSAHLHETEHWLGVKHDPNPYRIARTAAQTPAASTEER